MKNILLYIALLTGMVYLGSCNLNDYPTFDDKDAFVAFTAERFNITEDVGTFKLPVRLTSLKSQSSTVSFEVIDGSAVAGKDYNISGGASVINFDGNDPVKYLEIDIIEHEGVFTGDLQFSVVISNAGGVNIGGSDTTIVVIQDLDHPLAEILGNYDATAVHWVNGSDLAWSGTVFEKDPAGDVQKVWITGNILGNGGAGAGSKIYGLVNEDKTEITVPVHQQVVNASYNAYIDGVDDDGEIMDDGAKLVFEIKRSGNTIKIELKENAIGILAYNKDSGAYAGYYVIAEDLVYTKK